MNNEVCVVIRSVEERTEDACYNIVKDQLDSSQKVHIIRNKPFPEAHIKSIEIAIKNKTKWALFLDADILLKKNAIEQMLTDARSVSFPFFQMNFRILDRGFGGETYGVHFYATKNFSNALKYKDSALSAQRPEFQICHEMAVKERIPSITSPVLVALHGYQQYYADLYRTTFVRAIKYSRHLDYLFRLYTEGILNEEKNDQDMRFMFWGLVDGMIYGYDHDKAPLERSFYSERINRIYDILEVQEKRDFNIENGYVESIFNDYKLTALYQNNKNWICPSHGYTARVPDNSLRSKLRKNIQPILSRIRKSLKALIYG